MTIARFFCRAPSRFSRLFNTAQCQLKLKKKQAYTIVPLDHIHHLQIHLLFVYLLCFLKGGCMCLKGMNVPLTEVILRVWLAEQAAQQQR